MESIGSCGRQAKLILVELTLVILGRDSGEAEEATRIRIWPLSTWAGSPLGVSPVQFATKCPRTDMLANVTLIQNTFLQSMVTRAGFVGTTVRARQPWPVTCQFITEINEKPMLVLTAL